jgi:hypothetical protein
MNGEVEPERATGESPEAALPPALSKPDRVQSRVRVGALYRWGFFAGLGLLSSVAAVPATSTAEPAPPPSAEGA